MNKRILIITNEDDLHADVIQPILIAKGSRPFRLNLNAFPRDFQLHQQFFKGQWTGSIQHLPSGDMLPIADIGAVWVRKTADFTFLSDDLSPQELAYAKLETEHTLAGLLYSLDCYWLSHPLAIRGAQFKTEQMHRAVKFGFQIPATVISNHPDAVRAFKQELNDDLVFKAMSSAFLAADKVDVKDQQTTGLPTTLITDDDMDSLAAVAEVPCYFQAHIVKAYELRVTVIGDKVFAAKIDSQADERTKIDFRDFSVEVPYSAITLPANIEDRCRAFVHSYQLNYGALDIIVTPTGEYIFLENNPGGQFWFIEQLVPSLKMMAAVADCLIEGAQC